MKKFIYLFRGDLRSHLEIYKSWVDAAGNYIDIEMITSINFWTYLQQRPRVHLVRKQGIQVFVVPTRLTALFFMGYFLYMSFRCEKIIIHLRKRGPKDILLAKRILKSKLSYIIDIEGDCVAEAEYLKANPAPTLSYTIAKRNPQDLANKLEAELASADGVIVVTDEMRRVFASRFKKLANFDEKTCVLPTGFDRDKFFFDESLRARVRKELNLDDRFVYIFTGNIFYSWQNLSATLKIFEHIKRENLEKNPFLILLIRYADRDLALRFVNEMGFSDQDVKLLSVAHEEVNSYLNAADMGILLRDNHVMNKVACPGKLGEYLAAGLDVLTTPYIGMYSDALKREKIGLLIKDFRKLDKFSSIYREYRSSHSRHYISDWARRKFSSQKFAIRYVSFLNRM